MSQRISQIAQAPLTGAAITVPSSAVGPLVSVVMPCYNSAPTLTAAVESVLSQTYQNFELLLVNDGSNDGVTPELCDAFCVDTRVRVIHQKNLGLAGARNTGLREAAGEFIALLDSDDLYEPGKLAEHVAHFQSTPMLGLSFSYSRFISEEGKPLPIVQGDKVADITAMQVLCRNPVGNGSAAVIRKAALQDVLQPASSRAGSDALAYFDPELRQSEDVEFWLRLITTTPWHIAGLAKPLTRYRLSGGGLSANTKQQLATWEAFLEKAKGYAPELVKRYGGLARAYQLRYLCRRSIQMRQPVSAVRYLAAAFAEDAAILLEEPRRTLLTLAACGLSLALSPFLRLLPK